MEKKIKVGLIGAGQMAEYHVRGFLEGGAEVVAVADMNAEKGKAFAAKWGFPGEVYENLPVMAAAHPELDAVSVITPNKFHYPLVMEALERGLHVFCEKPPALNSGKCAKWRNLRKSRAKR